MTSIRIPRGFDVNRPYYNELCEGVRPNSQAAPREAWTGLAYMRIDEYQHDPIVLEPGTILGAITGGNAIGAGKLIPAVMGTGAAHNPGLTQVGETNNWSLPSASGDHSVGRVKPLGVCYQPVYSFMLQALYTNYTRNTSVGLLTDYVIQVPCINSEEFAIEVGDAVCLGTGSRWGIGCTATQTVGTHFAGRYAAVNKLVTTYPGISDLDDRVVGRCLNKIKLGSGGSATTAGNRLADKISDFTPSATATTEFSNLAKVQTVPGMTLSGSGTKGIPGYFLGARCDASKDYWAMTLLIRL